MRIAGRSINKLVLLLLLLLLLAISIAAAIAVVTIDGSSDEPSHGASPSGKAKVVNSDRVWTEMVKEGIREARGRDAVEGWPFSSVEKPVGGMPAHLVRKAKTMLGGGGPLRLRFKDAGYVTAPIGGGLWAVPGRAVVCVFRAVGLGLACRTLARAHREGAVLQAFEPGERPGAPPAYFLALGLVPDGVKAVFVRSGKSSRTVPVSDNAFAAKDDRPVWVTGFAR